MWDWQAFGWLVFSLLDWSYWEDSCRMILFWCSPLMKELWLTLAMELQSIDSIKLINWSFSLWYLLLFSSFITVSWSFWKTYFSLIGCCAWRRLSGCYAWRRLSGCCAWRRLFEDVLTGSWEMFMIDLHFVFLRKRGFPCWLDTFLLLYLFIFDILLWVVSSLPFTTNFPSSTKHTEPLPSTWCWGW